MTLRGGIEIGYFPVRWHIWAPTGDEQNPLYKFASVRCFSSASSYANQARLGERLYTEYASSKSLAAKALVPFPFRLQRHHLRSFRSTFEAHYPVSAMTLSTWYLSL